MTVKILIVDDETDLELLIRQRFRKKIKEKEYDFLFAHNGVEALEILQNDQQIHLVLSDINMPVMDGLTLLTKIKESHTLVLPVIVSAYGDLANIRTAMNRGAIDFLTKPIDFEDFEVTITKTLQQADTIVQASESRDTLAAVQRELSIANEIQQSLLPRAFPPYPGLTSVDIQATMIAARNVGGDFFDFYMIGEHRLGLVIGDVSGKGIPAAIFMAMSRTLMKAVASRGSDPGTCLSELNALLCRDNQAEMFVTVFYAILDINKHELSYSNGGHNAPYLIRSGEPAQALPGTQDTILGMIEGLTFKTKQISLNPDDLLFLYTDGVTEAMTPVREQFGDKRLEDFLVRFGSAPTAEIIREIIAAVRAFAGDAPQSDDLTVLALRYRPAT